ncbi:MAG: hypothetical protein OES47_12190 [Acidobacteriota bacterium]|nr:hypothetical protein [Acidobacteriota bacterium]
MTAEKKKGLGALGWILIGCLGILILGAVLTFACTAFVAKKVKDVGEEFADNPAMAAAEMIVKVNPDLELIDSDDESQTLTIRNKETGEMITLDVKDIQEGKFSAKIGDKEVVVDPGSDQGLIQISGGDDGETVTLGQGSLDDVAEWVPLYPDAKAKSPLHMATAEGVSGTVSMETSDSVEDVVAFYKEQLEEAEFEVRSSDYRSGDQVTSTVSGTQGEKTINVIVTQENGVTRVVASYSS